MSSRKIYLLITMVLFAQMISAGEDEFAAALKLRPNFENGMRIYRKCATCHNPQGWGDRTGDYPQISGQHINIIIKELTDIRFGKRENNSMMPFSHHTVLGGPQNIVDVAGHISRLSLCPDNEIGPGNDLASGASLYNLHCVKCHGENGVGNNDDLQPRMQAQHFSYLLRQIQGFLNGHRNNVDMQMVKQIEKLTERDQSIIADYISRFRPPPELALPNGCDYQD